MCLLNEKEISFDATVVLDFHSTGNVTLLQQVFPDRIMISDFVREQLGQADIVFTVAQVVELNTDHDLNSFEELHRWNPRLGLGEIGAIAVAQLRSAVLASNDGPTRTAAQAIGLEITGSLGILEYAVTSGNIDAAKAVRIAEHMILADAWFSEELIELFRVRLLAEN